jgi:hypothetical protein
MLVFILMTHSNVAHNPKVVGSNSQSYKPQSVLGLFYDHVIKMPLESQIEIYNDI